MNMRPKSIAVLASGIMLFLASTTAHAGDSFFSFSFGYSSHGHYVNPYRYVYAPAHYYVVPSPFFFGYTSYYYPVFPYYYTPVVYYRPVLPYYYPYAYQPHWFSYRHYYAYRGIYPRTYGYGYHPHNQYYSHNAHKHYKYSHGHHRDHFYGHRLKKQYAGSYKKYAPDNKLYSKQNKSLASSNHQSRNIAGTANERQRVRELEKYRSALRQNQPDRKTERTDNRKLVNEKRTFSANNTRSASLQKRDNQNVGRSNNRNFRSETSSQPNRNINNDVVERLVNRNRNPSRAETESNNRPVQQREIVTQQNDRRPHANSGNDRPAFSPAQAKQPQQQAVRSNMVKPRDSSLRQQPAMTARNNQNNQSQVIRQMPSTRNNVERQGNSNSLRQPAPGANNRQARANQQEPQAAVTKRRDSSGGINVRSGGGSVMQQKGLSQRSMGGSAFRR